MEHTHLTQLVEDRRSSRETDARDHRLNKERAEPTPREPRLRYERRLRPQPRRETLAEG
jgi:hypothetical protein